MAFRGKRALPVERVAVFGPDVQAEPLHFLHQNVEGLRSAGLQGAVSLDELLVNLGSALHVVGLDRKQFLQRVGRAVRFERPDLHLAEPLAAVLGLAAEGLLGDEAVRADRAGVDFVGYEVVELHHVDVADNYLLVEIFAREPVDEAHLAALGKPRVFEVAADVLFAYAVEHGSGDLYAQLLARPAEMRLENLPHVHSGGHAHRVEADFHGGSVGQIRHVLFGDYARDNALVAVAPRHLVADLNLALGGDVNLDGLYDVLVGALAALDGIHLAGALLFDFVEPALVVVDDLHNLYAHGRRVDVDVFGHRGEAAQEGLGNLPVCLYDDLARLGVADVERDFFAEQDVGERLGEVVAQLVGLGAVLFVDLARAAADVARGNFLVFAVALGGRLDVHYYALDARGDDEGGVFDVGGFFAEYGAQKLFFGSELGLRLRGNLADENVAGLHFRARRG